MSEEDFDFVRPLSEYTGGGGGSAANILKYMNKAGAQDLDFITDYEDLTYVSFHWDDEERVNIPCPGKKNAHKCPGCQKGIKPSAKILAVARDPKTGYVNVWQLPMSIKEALTRSFDRDGTLRARAFTLYRTDNASGVKYELERGDKYEEIPQVDEEPSITEVIKEAWNWATDPDYREQKKKEQSAAKEERASKPAPAKTERGANVSPKDKKTDEDEPPFDDSPMPTGEVNEAEIRAMSYLAMVRLASEEGVDYNDDMTKQQLADAIVEKLS